MRIEVIYAVTAESWDLELDCADGSSVEVVLQEALKHETFRHLNLDEIEALAVWGKMVSKEFILRDGDRLELLRPLQCDPMELRRIKAEQQT